MNALQHLASLLDLGQRAAGEPLPTAHRLDAAIDFLRARVASGTGLAVPDEAQARALAEFWATRRVATARDARLIAFGLAVPIVASEATSSIAPGATGEALNGGQTSARTPTGARVGAGLRVFDDALRLTTLLKAIDGWRGQPRRFRRCYQGLVHSYFAFDGMSDDAAPTTRDNWERLRSYLAARLDDISLPGADPDWVVMALASRHMFGPAPGEPYAAAWLRGDTAPLDLVCSRLGIASSSWFIRDVMLTQLREAGKLDDAAFTGVLDRLLEMLGKNPVLRDRGIATLLNRYAQLAQPTLHRGLYNAALLCWGNPWASADDPRWRQVSDNARGLVADWLKPELIDAFFSGFADDGAMASRRAVFWKRYAVGMDDLRFALPASAMARLGNRTGDPPLLRRKLDGAVVALQAGDAARAALLMRFGSVVLVEFAHVGHGVYGYSDAARVPFDANEPLTSVDPAPNTLRHPSRSLFLQHHDGQQSWGRWEPMFEALLKRQYGLEPGVRRVAQVARHVDLAVDDVAAPAIDLAMAGERGDDWDVPAQAGLSAHWQTAEAGAVAFGRAELAIFARVHALRIEDDSRAGGSVRVLTDDADDGVAWVLRRWGFVYDAGRWIREHGYR